MLAFVLTSMFLDNSPYLLLLFVLLNLLFIHSNKNKEKEGFTAPTFSRLGLPS